MTPRTAVPPSQVHPVRADRLRADARRNHEQILDAARDLFVERGAGAPLEDIAQRAGVGIGTLYRRFVNRDTLMREVVLQALTGTTEVAHKALAEEAEPFAALARYMHTALELRVSAVIPVLLERVDMNHGAVKAARATSARAVQLLLDAAHADGSLPPDVAFGDIGLMLVRLARPLPGPIPAELNDRLAHRHLDLLIEGLRPHPERRAVDGGLSLADLRAIGVDTAARAARRRGSA
ncbi:MAG: TetR/AcrR family transcriptional regulator [Actinomycetota bacterium]|nr:TetR/AcrR family transcriptional regulator [Actinomycetota bacterium]